MVKIKKRLGFGAIAASFVFIFNPNIHIIDVLPDAIGYLLLSLGLSQLADLNDDIEEALKLFRRMFFLGCIKILALFWIFGIVGVDDRASSILTATFTFSMLEVLFLVPAYNKLFAGITYLSMRSDYSINSKSIKAYTTFFLASKGILNTLPELCALSQYKNENIESASPIYNVDWFANIDLVRGFAFIPAFIICLIWLIKGLGWASRIIKETAFIDHLKTRYKTEILPKSELFLRKSINLGFLLFCFGVCLLTDFYMDIPTEEMNESYIINLLPDVLAVACILSGIKSIWQYIKSSRRVILFAGLLYAAVTSLKEIVATKFFRSHTILELKIDVEANSDYLWVKLCAILEGLVLVGFIFALILVLREIIRNHTGYAPISDNAAENKNTLDKIAYVHQKLYSKLSVAFIFAVIMALVNASYYFMLPYVEFAWLINFASSAIFAIVFIPKLFTVSEEIEYKYMLY